MSETLTTEVQSLPNLFTNQFRQHRISGFRERLYQKVNVKTMKKDKNVDF